MAINARCICVMHDYFQAVSNGEACETEVSQFLDIVNKTVLTSVFYVNGPLEMRGPIFMGQRVARLMDDDAVDIVTHKLDPFLAFLEPNLEYRNVSYDVDERSGMMKRLVMKSLQSLEPIIETFDDAWSEIGEGRHPTYRFIVKDQLWSIVPRVRGFGVYRRFIRDMPE